MVLGENTRYVNPVGTARRWILRTRRNTVKQKCLPPRVEAGDTGDASDLKKKTKRKTSKLKRKRKPIRLELVNPPNFYESMLECMASENYGLDERRKPSDYIR
jgi:hypothetical protein